MPKKINQEKSDSQTTEEQMEELLSQNQTLTELINLKDEAYFKMKLLMTLEKIAEGITEQTNLLKDEEKNGE